MPRVTLTSRLLDRTVRPPPGKQVWLWDAVTPGLGVCVQASRLTFARQWRQAPGNMTKRVTLGHYPQLSVEAARQLAAGSAPSPIANGTETRSDMGPDYRATRIPPTVADFLDTFITEYAIRRYKPKTLTDIKLVIRVLLKPAIGAVSLATLRRSHIADLLAHAEHPIFANRAVAYLSSACSYAVEREWIPSNPCIGVTRNQENVRNRYFTDDELRRIAGALATIPPYKHGDATNINTTRLQRFLPFLAITGLRVGECLALTRDAIDADREVVRLADSKTGPLIIRLTESALRASERIAWTDEGTIGLSYTAIRQRMDDIFTAAKINDAMLHTFRHTMATYMAEHGSTAFEIMAAGGWKTLTMVERYVTLHGVGKRHPLPAHERIARAFAL